MLFPGAISTSVAFFVSSRTPALLFPGRNLLRDAIYACPESSVLLLLLRVPVALKRNLGCWLWCCEPRGQYSISALRNHSVNTVSWYCGVSDDCKSFCLPELQSLILRSGSFYPVYCILIVFPISLVMYFLRNSVIMMGFFFICVVTEWIQRCEEDCLSSFVILFSSRNWSTLQKWIEKSTKFPL